jgi:hypothetical protein
MEEFVFSMVLVLGMMNVAHAGTDNGNGNGGQNKGNQYGHDQQPLNLVQPL